MRTVLVTLADARYLDAAKQLFASAHYAGGWRGDYLLLAHDMPEADTADFRAHGIQVRHVAPLIQGRLGPLPGTVASKFYLFDDFFKQWDRVIYLDADIMVRASLDLLPTGNGTLQAVRDLCNLRAQFMLQGRELYPHDGPAFNSGVMMFDTSINSEATFSEIVSEMKSFSPFARFADQPILNHYFHKRWTALPTDFNGYAHLRAFGFNWPVFRGSTIVHFACKPKPWDCAGPSRGEWNANRTLFDAMNVACRQGGRNWSRSRLLFNRIMRAVRFRLSRLDTWAGTTAATIRSWTGSRSPR